MGRRGITAECPKCYIEMVISTRINPPHTNSKSYGSCEAWYECDFCGFETEHQFARSRIDAKYKLDAYVWDHALF